MSLLFDSCLKKKANVLNYDNNYLKKFRKSDLY